MKTTAIYLFMALGLLGCEKPDARDNAFRHYVDDPKDAATEVKRQLEDAQSSALKAAEELEKE